MHASVILTSTCTQSLPMTSKLTLLPNSDTSVFAHPRRLDLCIRSIPLLFQKLLRRRWYPILYPPFASSSCRALFLSITYLLTGILTSCMVGCSYPVYHGNLCGHPHSLPILFLFLSQGGKMVVEAISPRFRILPIYGMKALNNISQDLTGPRFRAHPQHCEIISSWFGNLYG